MPPRSEQKPGFYDSMAMELAGTEPLKVSYSNVRRLLRTKQNHEPIFTKDMTSRDMQCDDKRSSNFWFGVRGALDAYIEKQRHNQNTYDLKFRLEDDGAEIHVVYREASEVQEAKPSAMFSVGPLMNHLVHKLYISEQDELMVLPTEVSNEFLVRIKRDMCVVCKLPASEGQVLICDGCDRSLHLKCSSYKRTPKEAAYCPACQQKMAAASSGNRSAIVDSTSAVLAWMEGAAAAEAAEAGASSSSSSAAAAVAVAEAAAEAASAEAAAEAAPAAAAAPAIAVMAAPVAKARPTPTRASPPGAPRAAVYSLTAGTKDRKAGPSRLSGLAKQPSRMVGGFKTSRQLDCEAAAAAAAAAANGNGDDSSDDDVAVVVHEVEHEVGDDADDGREEDVDEYVPQCKPKSRGTATAAGKARGKNKLPVISPKPAAVNKLGDKKATEKTQGRGKASKASRDEMRQTTDDEDGAGNAAPPSKAQKRKAGDADAAGPATAAVTAAGAIDSMDAMAAAGYAAKKQRQTNSPSQAAVPRPPKQLPLEGEDGPSSEDDGMERSAPAGSQKGQLSEDDDEMRTHSGKQQEQLQGGEEREDQGEEQQKQQQQGGEESKEHGQAPGSPAAATGLGQIRGRGPSAPVAGVPADSAATKYQQLPHCPVAGPASDVDSTAQQQRQEQLAPATTNSTNEPATSGATNAPATTDTSNAPATTDGGEGIQGYKAKVAAAQLARKKQKQQKQQELLARQSQLASPDPLSAAPIAANNSSADANASAASASAAAGAGTSAATAAVGTAGGTTASHGARGSILSLAAELLVPPPGLLVPFSSASKANARVPCAPSAASPGPAKSAADYTKLVESKKESIKQMKALALKVEEERTLRAKVEAALSEEHIAYTVTVEEVLALEKVKAAAEARLAESAASRRSAADRRVAEALAQFAARVSGGKERVRALEDKAGQLRQKLEDSKASKIKAEREREQFKVMVHELLNEDTDCEDD